MQRKEELLRAASRMAIAGLGVVGLAVSGALALALVLSYVTPGLPAVVITAVFLALYAGLWFAFPLSRRAR
jgi:hypothetical protein